MGAHRPGVRAPHSRLAACRVTLGCSSGGRNRGSTALRDRHAVLLGGRVSVGEVLFRLRDQQTLQRLSSELRQLERNVFKALDDQEMQQLTGLLDRAGASWIS